ncbi:MAG: hypothetical protein M0Z99_32045 [Betaproteobacteria bacterium]|nr:hypothetical protein [Betaproteobacteria bacterium]
MAVSKRVEDFEDPRAARSRVTAAPITPASAAAPSAAPNNAVTQQAQPGTPWTFTAAPAYAPTESNAGDAIPNPGEGTWSGGTGQAPVNVGYVYDRNQGVWGAIYKDRDTGKFYHNGQELPGWTDATAQANLGATQQALTNEKNNKNFGTAFDRFGDSLGPGIALLPLAIAAMTGSLAVNAAGSAAAGEASYGSLATGAVPGSEAFASSVGASGGDAIGSLIASNAGAWGVNVAPEVAALGMGATAGAAASSGVDKIGSDWAAGEMTGSPGGLLETTPEGLTAANTEAASGIPGSVNSGYTTLPGSGVSDEQLLTGQGQGVDGGLGKLAPGETGWTDGPDSFTVPNWAKMVGKELVKGVIKSVITGTPTTPTRPGGGVDINAPADTTPSFASLGAQSFGSTQFQSLTRSKFQVDTKALADAGIAYTSRG